MIVARWANRLPASEWAFWFCWWFFKTTRKLLSRIQYTISLPGLFILGFDEALNSILFQQIWVLIKTDGRNLLDLMLLSIVYSTILKLSKVNLLIQLLTVNALVIKYLDVTWSALIRILRWCVVRRFVLIARLKFNLHILHIHLLIYFSLIYSIHLWIGYWICNILGLCVVCFHGVEITQIES